MAERTIWDNCVCTVNATDGPGTVQSQLGLFSECLNGTNITTEQAPISHRPLNNSITGLCTSRHCCEYKAGEKPVFRPGSCVFTWQATQLYITYTVMGVFSVLGLIMYMLQPRIVRGMDFQDVRRKLPTLFAALMGVIACSLGSDLLLYSTAIGQEAYGHSWLYALKVVLYFAVAVDASTAFLTLLCIMAWLGCHRDIMTHALAHNCEGLLEGMRKNLDMVTARLVKSILAGILCCLLIFVTPMRILYDGSSGLVIKDHDILDEHGMPAQTQFGNEAKLRDINLLVDVLMGVLMLPLFMSLTQNAAAAVNMLYILMHLGAELGTRLCPQPVVDFITRVLNLFPCGLRRREAACAAVAGAIGQAAAPEGADLENNHERDAGRGGQVLETEAVEEDAPKRTLGRVLGGLPRMGAKVVFKVVRALFNSR